MASTLAIVSKAVFDGLVRAHGQLEPGAVVPLDRYLSANKALASLAQGGALYLVTVRPPSEALWLVAILEAPRFTEDHWVARPNATPITDISGLMPRLRFESGAGLAPKPGLLGASLQTPRRLTAADEALLRGAAGAAGPAAEETPMASATAAGEPASPAAKAGKRKKPPAAKAPAAAAAPPAAKAPVAKSPAATDADLEARQRDEVIAALAAARSRLAKATEKNVDAACAAAATAPSKVVKQLKQIAKSLGETAEMAAAWDVAAAAILSAANKSKSAAGDCHGYARVIERALGSEERDPTRRLLRDAVFARAGALWMKELIATLKACTQAQVGDLAGLVVQMAVDTVTVSGEEPNAKLFPALALYGEDCAPRFLGSSLVRDGGKTVREAGWAYWDTVRPILVTALADDDELVRWIATYIPQCAGTPWIQMLLDADIARRFAEVDPELALPCLELVASTCVNRRAEEAELRSHCERVFVLVDQLARVLEGRDVAVANIRISWLDLTKASWREVRAEHLASQFGGPLPLDLLELLLEHGLAIEHRQHVNYDCGSVTPLWSPASGRPRDRLDRVAADPVLGPLVELLLDHDLSLLRRWSPIPSLERALTFLDGQAEALPLRGEGLADVTIAQRNRSRLESCGYQVRALSEAGTVGGLEACLDELGRLTVPGVAAFMPETCRRILGLDLAVLLRNQLRAGVLDELWDARRQRLRAQLGAKTKVRSSYPYAIAVAGARVVVEGPEGVVLDQQLPHDVVLEEQDHVYYLDGDVLVCGFSQVTSLLGRHAPLQVKLYRSVQQDLLRGGLIRADGRRFERVADLSPPSPELEQHGANVFWYDERHVYRTQGGNCRDIEDERRATLEVGSGKQLKAFVMPAFFAEKLAEGDVPRLKYSFFRWVAPGGERCPGGARDGLSAFACWHSRAQQIYVGETNTGLRATFPRPFEGLMQFPGRSEVLLVDDDHSLFFASGLVLVPKDETRANRYRYWASNEFFYGSLWTERQWLEPRDLEGSRALAAATVEQARALLERAREYVAAGAGAPHTGGQESRIGNMVASTGGRDEYVEPLGTWPALAAAVEAAFPAIGNAQLRAGVVRLAITAAEVEQKLAPLRARLEELLPTLPASPVAETAPAGAVATTGDGAASPGARNTRALDPLFGWWGPSGLRHEPHRQIAEVAEWLFAKPARQAQASGDGPRVVQVAQCRLEWTRCLTFGGEFLFHLLAPATSEAMREALRRFCEQFAGTALARHTARLRRVGLELAAPPVPGIDRDHQDLLVEWQRQRLFLHCYDYAGPWRFACLHPHGEDFVLPPGATLLWQDTWLVPLTAERVDAALALLRERGPFPFDAAAARLLAEETGMLYGTAAMVLAGAAYDRLTPEVRRLLGMSADDVKYGKEELGWNEDTRELDVSLHAVLARALPGELDALYRPGELTLARNVAAAWRAEHGAHRPFELALVRRLADELREPHPSFLSHALTLTAPEERPALTTDVAWVHRPWLGGYTEYHPHGPPRGWPVHATTVNPESWPDPRAAFSYEALDENLRLLAWANLELEGESALRQNAATLVRLLRARLAAPGLLLPVATGPIQEPAAFWRWVAELGGAPYVAASSAGATGVVRDGLVLVWPSDEQRRDGVFVSLVPAALTERARWQRCLAALGVDEQGTLRLPGVKLRTADPYWRSYRLWQSEGFQSLLDELVEPGLPAGKSMADPRVSAPQAVSAVRARHPELSEPAAVLYLQVSVLAEPSTARVARYCAWDAGTLERAAQELVTAGLVEEKRFRGARHTLFLPGELVYFEGYPAPVERSKLAPLGLVAGARPPLGVPLPLCSLRQAFDEGSTRLSHGAR